MFVKKLSNINVVFFRLLVVLGIVLILASCQEYSIEIPIINDQTLSPTVTSTEEPPETLAPTNVATMSVGLQESKHNRDEVLPRIFSTLTAETSQAIITFEVGKTTDQSDIGEIYDSMVKTIEKVLERFPIKTAEKPEFFILERDGSGKLLEHPQFYGKRTLIPYSAIENGQLLEILVKGIAYESEPWVAYGLAGLLSGDQVEVDLGLIQDTDKLFLTGISFEEEYITDDDLAASKALAGAFMRYILANYGEDVLMELIENSSNLDVYGALKAWSGITNSYFDLHPEVLFGTYSYSDAPGYFLRVYDGNSNFYFRMDHPLISPLKDPGTIYSFLDRYHRATEKISNFALDNQIDVISSGFNIYTNSTDYTFRGGMVEGMEIHFGQDGWRLTLEHELIHAMLGSRGSGTNEKWLREGLTSLFADKVIFGPEIFEMAGYPEVSYYNILRDVKDNVVDDSYFRLSGAFDFYKNAVGYYTKFASLEEENGELNYDVYVDSAAYAWIVYCEERQISPETAIKPTIPLHRVPMIYEVYASYVNFLIEQKGILITDLVHYYQTEIPKELTEYTGEWLDYIRGNWEE
ncbi:MAG TPA: hypothetical protein DD636_06525 [Anaerolineaceae bacterium]|nr:hypothetical protein [Anaerolineaceae bacterium]